MSFDLAAFEQKIGALTAALPAIGGLVQAAAVIAPQAAGLTKAGLVINTVIAAEPLFAGCEQMLGVAITGLVNAYRSAGTLPPAAPQPAPMPSSAPMVAQQVSPAGVPVGAPIAAQ